MVVALSVWAAEPLLPEPIAVRAQAYTGARVALGVVRHIAVITLLVWLSYSGRGVRWWERVAGRAGPRLAPFAYIASIVLLMGAAALPFEAWKFHLGRAYGVVRLTFGAWLGGSLGRLTVAAAVAGIVLPVLYGMARKYPRTWWRLGLMTVILTSVLVSLSGSTLMGFAAPLDPLPPGALRHQIESMLQREGIGLAEICIEPASERTRVPNAYLAGLGPETRLVLTDALTESFTTGEVLFVIAHELSHLLLRHLWLDMVLSVVAGVVGFLLLLWIVRGCLRRSAERLGYRELHEIASFPLVCLIAICLSLAGKLPANAVSRHFEDMADRQGLLMAMRAGGEVEDAVSVLRKLGTKALADPEPPVAALCLFWPHPPLAERVANLRAAAASMPGTGEPSRASPSR
jgi:Zn-dependent protease with chaperone function